MMLLLCPLSNLPSLYFFSGQPLNVACKAFFGFSGESGPMIYWTRGERFIEELENHIKEGEIRYYGGTLYFFPSPTVKNRKTHELISLFMLNRQLSISIS